MTRVWSLVLLVLVAGAVASCKSPGPSPAPPLPNAWPFTKCPLTNDPANETLDEIMNWAAADMQIANASQKSKILLCGARVVKCWLGTQPPINEPAMTLTAHCKKLEDALAYAQQDLMAMPNKWDLVFQELGHGH